MSCQRSPAQVVVTPQQTSFWAVWSGVCQETLGAQELELGGSTTRLGTCGRHLLRHSPGWQLIWIPQTCLCGGRHLLGVQPIIRNVHCSSLSRCQHLRLASEMRTSHLLEAREKMRKRKHRRRVSVFKPGSPRDFLSLGPTSWFCYGHPENEVSSHWVPSPFSER